MLFSCNKDNKLKENSVSSKSIKEFIYQADVIESKINNYLIKLSPEEQENIRFKLLNDQDYFKSFLESTGIYNDLINLSKTREYITINTDFYELSTQQHKDLFSKNLYDISTRVMEEDSDCRMYLQRARDRRGLYYIHSAACLLTTSAEPLAFGVCISAATVDFSQDMRELERDYPDCIK